MMGWRLREVAAIPMFLPKQAAALKPS